MIIIIKKNLLSKPTIAQTRGGPEEKLSPPPQSNLPSSAKKKRAQISRNGPIDKLDFKNNFDRNSY